MDMSEEYSFQSLIYRGFKTILIVVTLIMILLWSLWDWEFQGLSIGNIWAQTDRVLFLLSILLISTALPCVAMRWRALFPKEEKNRLNPLEMTGLLCVAFVFNIVLPGPVGEGVAAWALHKRSDVSVGNSIAGLGLSRIIGLGSACSIAGIVYWLAPFSIEPRWGRVLLLTSVVLGVLALGMIALVLLPQIPRRILRIFRSWRILQVSFIQRLFGILDALLDALIETAGRGWNSYLESLFWALCGHGLVASGIYLAVVSMGMTAEWSAVMFTYSASIAGSVAMFLFPGSAIGWDILFATTLRITANLPETVVVAVTAVVRIQQLMVAIAGGAIVILQSREIWEEAFAFGRKREEEK